MGSLYFSIINQIIADTLKIFNREKQTAEVQKFVAAQVAAMPDFLRFGIQMATILANYLFLPLHFRPFSKLSPERKLRYFELFGRVKLPLLANLYRFHSSLIILKSLELEAAASNVVEV